MSPGLPETLKLATGMAKLDSRPTCESSPAVDSSRHGGTRTGLRQSPRKVTSQSGSAACRAERLRSCENIEKNNFSRL
jgi:hypothetical protein